jgi:hypothetical protein
MSAPRLGSRRTSRVVSFLRDVETFVDEAFAAEATARRVGSRIAERVAQTQGAIVLPPDVLARLVRVAGVLEEQRGHPVTAADTIAELLAVAERAIAHRAKVKR